MGTGAPCGRPKRAVARSRLAGCVMICYEVADIRRNSSSCGMPGAILMLLLASAQSAARNRSSQTITPNFKDADLTQVAEAVSVATGKNFIIDPARARRGDNVVDHAMSPAAFYEAFLAILQVHGSSLCPPETSSRFCRTPMRGRSRLSICRGKVSATSDEIVTQVVDVKNVSAAQLVPILRPMIPQYGHLAAYPASNILIISDRASNVNRMIRIIRRVDQVGDQSVEIVPLQNASSTETVRVLNSLFQQAAACRGRCGRESCSRRTLQQCADQRRPVAAVAHSRAGGGIWTPRSRPGRYASALPALCRC